MGGGAWDPGVYSRTTGAAAAAGTSFGYTRSVHSGAVAAAVHDLLDPKKVAGAASPLAGQLVREARDNDEHPNSVPIIVAFDETGSMGSVPVLLQKKLAELFALLLRKGYVEDPQLAVGAYGDLEIGEVAPIQIGQFESDNRADETLDNIYLEGNGGGNGHESAAGIWYYAAAYTATDAWEKRGKKGYLFTVGDETTGGVRKSHWKHYVDPNSTLEGDLTAQEVADLAKERWDVYHVIINNTAARGQRSIEHYETLLGKDHVIVLENEDTVCEAIALVIGIAEGSIDLDQGLEDLDDVGSTADRGEVSKALARFGGGVGGAVAVADAPADLEASDAGASRL
jgi:hypothetical protein